MLYPKNKEQTLEPQVFKNPTSEYRGTPFWSWNTKLDKSQLLEQIDQLKEMGMGGFHIHSRTGMATKYLSDEFMDLVKACHQKAKENNMLCWLYDEDRWPSGFAGGYVTREEKYRARFLVFSPNEYINEDGQDVKQYSSSGRAQRSTQRSFIGKYEVTLEDGYLSSYRRLKEDEVPKEDGKIWWAYIEIAGNNPWFNNQAYVNTLDPEAIKKFIDITHERYYDILGEDFGDSIPAIFTDEPQFTHKQRMGFAEEEKDIIVPYTDDFEETYQQEYGVSLLDSLPELFWELPNGEVSLARYRYHDHLSERFASAFSDLVGGWCAAHNIMLTGHMMSEPTLDSQTRALGEAMRSYRSFQLPGIDMLCDKREYSTAKQAQSAAHQYGRPGVLSELYGVTNWDFDFRGHKLQGDWQAALGVTVRVHHLTWVSMEGEAKRDYPASIGYQSPWYKEYPLIENHFSRLNTALTRGKPRVRVGVIHPVESYWLYWGPEEQTSEIREELETNFTNITEWLLFGLIDFDYIAESLLPSLSETKEEQPMKVGEMEYDVILVPGCKTLRASTIERLEAFRKAGGEVIFIGDTPELMDAIPSDKVQEMAKRCTNIPFSRSRVLQSLEEYRELKIMQENGKAADNLFYQMREDGARRWLFICHVKKMKNPDIGSMEKINIHIKGTWKPVVYNTMNGEISPCDATIVENETRLQYEFSQHDSLLLCLEPGKPEKNKKIMKEDKRLCNTEYLQEEVTVTLSEPNVLLLDMAEYAFDNGGWQPKEEILRIDNSFRKQLGYPMRMDAVAQPWVNPEEKSTEHKLSLRFIIDSEIEIKGGFLALEHPENTEIMVNNKKISSQADGWYVDQSIKKVPIPTLSKGRTEIVLHIPFGPKTNVEWCYLLGDFGVNVEGARGKIIEPVRKLAFGDWTHQALPFYGGNVTYHCEFITEEGIHDLEIPQFRNPLVSVALDGKEKGKIAFAPYDLALGKLDAGKHKVDITAFGNRVNTFGTLHNCDHSTTWFGPNSWRTTGSSWSYEYQLKQTGILVAPRLHCKK